MAGSKFGLLSLPIEVLLDTLAILDFISLLRCRKASRFFKHLVDNTSSLQYIIELAASGQVDGPIDKSINVFSRLQALKKQQEAWHTGQWRQESDPDALNQGGLWELYGGVLAQVAHDQSITFHQLPSHVRGIEKRHWTIEPNTFEFTVRDFGIDPSQDLLVLIEPPSWSVVAADHLHRFHLRTMSTGERHPLAPQDAVFSHMQRDQDLMLSYSIQISGDYVGVLLHRFEVSDNELMIWDWKKGQAKVNILGDEVRSFQFLSDKHFIVCLTPMFEAVPTLAVFDIDSVSSERHTLDEIKSTFTLHYPGIRDEHMAFECQLRCDPAPSWRPSHDLKVPFSVDTENRIFIMSLWAHFQDTGMHCFISFIPRSTFERCLSAVQNKQHEADFQWQDWSPNGSRMIRSGFQHSMVWVTYVYGSRFVIGPDIDLDPDNSDDDDDDESLECGFLYDFNQLGLKRSLSKDPEAHSRSSESENGWTEYVIGEQEIEGGQLFSDAIRTSLPYRLRRFRIPQNLLRRPTVILCSEDNLIFLNVSIFI
ncbi:hypothetical protein BDQ12DRAFT_599035 [Crucibulum laeve]|uniref:F-box domain-containing protein n=1 Tax=Crucibulum laeve TaxID=68775 RepID=A0A5C3MBV4_9AGAR|nr:hypothetical protein BDQ12DRAFT_599035 [Crucibulum laeve]